jgi:hypothetical protein
VNLEVFALLLVALAKPRGRFRKCFIDALDAEFHVAAHWKKG